MNLSVCIITKNEKETLRHCLENLMGYDFEIVVADTGSTDGTIPMALNYTQSVYEFPWCNDFAKAKNFAVSKAKNDMVFVLDSDEFLIGFKAQELSRLIETNAKGVGRILRKNQILQNQETLQSTECINRIFNRKLFHYEGKIHEQLVANDGLDYPTYLAPVTIDHCGYFLTEEEKKQKASRNLALLKEALSDQPDDPYLIYQLGKSYYMMKDYDSACRCFSQALSFELEPELEYVIDMVNCYGYALLGAGRAEEALRFTGIEEAFGQTSDFCFLMGFIYMNNELYQEAVLSFEKAVSLHKCGVTGVDSYLAYYNIGVIYECLSKMEQAVDYYWKCKSYLPAVRRLGKYFEDKNPAQAYLYYRQMAYLCTDSQKQELIKLAEQTKTAHLLQIPKTAIVILSYNTQKETQECIESIQQNCIPGSYELIVVDNASTDGSAGWLKQQAGLKLLCNPTNQGFVRGCIQGIHLAEADSDIWLLNSDTLVTCDSLFWLCMGLYENEKTGACGSVSNYCPNYQNIEEMGICRDNYLDYAKRHPVSISNPYEKKSWLVGFSLLLKRMALSETGLLDERFSPGNYEDTDLGYRLAEAGYTQLLCKNSFVFHYGSRSFGKQKDRHLELLSVNQEKFIEKWKIHPSRYSYIKTWGISNISKDTADHFSVLDLGCGTGATLARVQYLYPKADVLGMERMAKAAKLAQMVTNAICADALDYPKENIAESSMDYIFTEGIWEHIADPAPLLQKIHHWLKPSGILTGSIYNAGHPFKAKVPKHLKSFDIGIQDEDHAAYYAIEEWIALLEKNNIALDELSFCREAHSREIETPYQYFWMGHYTGR